MNLAVSSIAWTNEEESAVADKLVELGVKHVEIAPTKLWNDPTITSEEDARAYTKWWADRGIQISAFQSMLFSRPDLKIFESETNRQETIAYMTKFFNLARIMGGKKLVFGSPKNRQKGGLTKDEADEIADGFFKTLGVEAAKQGVLLCLEPNAPQYSCDYITNATEGDQLVRSVDELGFRLHLDTACMTLAGDDFERSITQSKDILEHFHISSPMLDQVQPRDDVDHVAAARTLHKIGYSNLVSIEMRPGDAGTNVQRVEAAVQFAQATYFG